jgi:hypothetical protein
MVLSSILMALVKDDFELRLLEDGALAIFDRRWRPEFDVAKVKRREPSRELVRLVFSHADELGRWLERRAVAAE